MNKVLLCSFIVCAIYKPTDILELSRYRKANVENCLAYVEKNYPIPSDLYSYGFGIELLTFWSHYKNGCLIENMMRKPLHALRFSLGFPFLWVSINLPHKVHCISNFVLLLLCLYIIKKLNKIRPSFFWSFIPFFMFFTSFRAFLPGIAFLLFFVEPCLLTRFLMLLSGSFSSAILALFSIVNLLTIKREHISTVVPLVCILMMILFFQKGFCWGHVQGNSKYDVRLVPHIVGKIIRNSRLFSFSSVNEEGFKKYYIIGMHLKYCFFVLQMLINLFCCIKLYSIQKKRIAFVYLIMFSFAFLEGYGYAACSLVIISSVIMFTFDPKGHLKCKFFRL